ncbi:EAL domain-containing protein [Pigmentiphaga sp.]|uniref:EAL domain-containing protein n=1 Tax=Pigmentiphaga sp. TaxID=1977564 RepID=UPI0025DD3D62|nr:EAL domain-containing protein [Pigmentiphaga sp.]
MQVTYPLPAHPAGTLAGVRGHSAPPLVHHLLAPPDIPEPGAQALAFQPVSSLLDGTRNLYQSVTVRLLAAPDDDAPAAPGIPLVQAVMAVLRDHSWVTLGCAVSAGTLADGSGWAEVLDELRADNQLARRLVIELAQDDDRLRTRQALGLAARLRRLGCLLAVDDFGTAGGTVDFLLDARPDIVKIAPAYLRRARSLHGAGETSGLIRLCRRLAPAVVIQGVDDPADLPRLPREAGVWIQGGLSGPPVLRSPWLRHSPWRLATCATPRVGERH